MLLHARPAHEVTCTFSLLQPRTVLCRPPRDLTNRGCRQVLKRWAAWPPISLVCSEIDLLLWRQLRRPPLP